MQVDVIWGLCVMKNRNVGVHDFGSSISDGRYNRENHQSASLTIFMLGFTLLPHIAHVKSFLHVVINLRDLRHQFEGDTNAQGEFILLNRINLQKL